MILCILSDDGVWLELTTRVNRNDALDWLKYYEEWFHNDKFTIRKM